MDIEISDNISNIETLFIAHMINATLLDFSLLHCLSSISRR